MTGRRGDGAGRGLVVEGDVAAGHRQTERPARVRQAAHALAQLPERLGPGRVAVVEAVGDAQGPGAGDRDVAGRLRDGQRRAQPRIERPDRLVAVRRGDERPGRALHPQDGGAAAGSGDGVGADRRVVLVVDGVARRQVGRPEEAEQDGPRVHPALRQAVADHRRCARSRGAAPVGGRRRDPGVDDRVARQRRGRDAGDLTGARRRPSVRVQPALDDRDVAVVGDPSDDRDRQAPALAHLADVVPALGQDGRAHPFLRLGDHDLEGREPRLAARDRVEVDHDPRPGPVGRLRGGAGDPAGPEVLEPLDEPALDQLEAGLDQQLLRERVADLDGRPLRRVVVGEGGAGQDGRAADPVPPGRRAVQDDEVARSRRRGQRQPPLLEQADGHDVDQRVAAVARVEDELATDRRDTDAVAVAADPAHDAVDQVPGPGIGRIAEAEGVEDGDRPGAHREDVAQDAADAGRGTLVGLDRGRVVVGLDLERDREPVADRDDAGVLARPGDDALALRRQRPEQRLRALVRAVLAPHDAEHRELEVVRVAPTQPVADGVELVVGDAQPAMERFGRALGHGHRGPAAPTATEPALRRSRRALDQRPDDAETVLGARGSPRTPAPDGASGRRRCRPRFMTPAIARSEPFGLAGSSGPAAAPARVDVAEEDLAVALERVERRVVRVEAALAVGDGHAAAGVAHPARG